MSGERMKLKFKLQPYQTDAVNSVIDCFSGQPISSGISYRIDPGKGVLPLVPLGLKNSDLSLTDTQILENIHVIQRRQNLPLSEKLVHSANCKINLDVEM